MLNRGAVLFIVALAAARPSQAESLLSTAANCPIILPSEPIPWTEPERWAWNEICDGRAADFARRALVGSTANRDASTSNLSERFLRTLLFKNPSHAASLAGGIKINGARFPDFINLQYVAVDADLSITNSEFTGGLDFSHIRTNHLISLRGSRFARLTGESARIGDDLQLEDITSTSVVNLNRIEVARSLYMRGARLQDSPALNLNGAKINDHLELLELRASGGIVNLDNIRVGGDLNLSGSSLRALWLSNSRVGRQLSLSDLELPAAQGASAATVIRNDGAEAGELKLNKLEIGQDLAIYNSRPAFVTIRDSIIAGGLALEGPKDKPSLIRAVDLTNTRIGRTLSFGSAWYGPIRWTEGAELSLGNVSAQALQDGLGTCDAASIVRQNTWPARMVLGGFSVQQLVTLDGTSQIDMAACSQEWWLGWLARQQSCSPHAYEALATVLERHGYKSKAKAIQYAGKNCELRKATGADYLSLKMQQLITGYGHYNFRALYWAALFVAVGALVLRVTKEGNKHGMPYGVAFSIDMLLPFVKLRDAHYKIDLRPPARYYFYVHRVVGFLLASFILAGVSGLTN